MKKSFFTAAGLMLFALAFSSCQKEPAENAPAASEPNFTLFAQPSSATKTTNEGLDTKWTDGDAINVFHAAAGTTTYVSDGQFSLKDTESGKFDGTVSSLTTDASYDWYAFYPYSSYLKTSPKNTSESYCYIGSRSDQSQSQTGDDNMSHICGVNYPLFGIVRNIKSSDTPSITMQHLTSVIKIVVTNSTDEELSLSSVSFTAEEDIAGQFYIAFDSETPTYTPTKNAIETANLTVSGVNVAAGGKGTVYMAVKPFTAKTGSTLKLSVNGYEKTLPLTSDVTFTAGHIKTLGFDFDSTDKTAVFNFADPESLGITKPATSKYTEIKTPIVNGNITMTATNGSSTNTRIYNSKGTCDLRVYKDGTIKFTAVEGFNISSISFDGSVADSKVSCDCGSFKSKVWTGESQSVTFTASDGINISSATVSYKKGVVLPRLATPEVAAEPKNINSIYATWDIIEGAKDYTVTCGSKEITVSGDEYTFEGLAYSTEYTISVVANPSDDTVNAPSAPGTTKAKTGANPAGEPTEKVLIIDAAKLTSTATTKDETFSFDGIDFIFSKGAKAQVSKTATNSFSDNASILIGKSGAYIYNKTPIPGIIKKFEIYANDGASTKVSVGVNFSASSISSYSAKANNTYTATLSKDNAVYDCSDKLPANAKYFWYQVTNSNNSQVQFRITYVE